MKTTITISLDQELVYKLKEENNYSDLINMHMNAYYNVKDVQNIQILKQNLEKSKVIVKENRKKQREIIKTIEKLKQKEKDLIDKCRINIKKTERDPVRDPTLWIERGFDKKYPKEWEEHLKYC
jgi:D-hexose-6-phosphate mutarotase